MKQVDVAIIGGGPAGISAAIVLARGDTSLVLIDSYPQPGGHYFRQSSIVADSAIEAERQAEFGSLMAELDRVEILSGATVWSVFRDVERGLFTLHLQGHAVRSVQAAYLLLAPGSYDRPFPFLGWHLPGVITLGGAQMLLKGHGILPGKRLLVAGGGPLLFPAAAGLLEAGADLVAVLDTASAIDGALKMGPAFWGQWGRIREAWRAVSTIRRRRVPILFGHAVFRAIGGEAVTGAGYGKIDGAGVAQRQTERIVDVDTICVALGFLPNLALSRHLGCDHFYDATLDAYYPGHDETMETSVARLYVAGDVTGAGGKDLSKAQGQIAGINILGKLGRLAVGETRRQTAALQRAARREGRFVDLIRQRMRLKPGYLELLDDDTIVCRCEMVTVRQIKTAVLEGARDLRGAKLRTRCGMGACQGRICEQIAGALMARETGQPREAIGVSSIRPPLVPIPVEEILR